ncbi:hypothetical protein FB45DRAFT_861228 [Roridomyces roridus]|uniref:Uncharacterized protein n=1 Tax=Roridomyces roridus TaxID=1738132 RepID=A0AAD7FU36_9AGAR|nr:hypothetical protein FB45DRAFT_861228 [Roridomyces roridus]
MHRELPKGFLLVSDVPDGGATVSWEYLHFSSLEKNPSGRGAAARCPRRVSILFLAGVRGAMMVRSPTQSELKFNQVSAQERGHGVDISPLAPKNSGKCLLVFIESPHRQNTSRAEFKFWHPYFPPICLGVLQIDWDSKYMSPANHGQLNVEAGDTRRGEVDGDTRWKGTERVWTVWTGKQERARGLWAPKMCSTVGCCPRLGCSWSFGSESQFSIQQS